MWLCSTGAWEIVCPEGRIVCLYVLFDAKWTVFNLSSGWPPSWGERLKCLHRDPTGPGRERGWKSISHLLHLMTSIKPINGILRDRNAERTGQSELASPQGQLLIADEPKTATTNLGVINFPRRKPAYKGWTTGTWRVRAKRWAG